MRRMRKAKSSGSKAIAALLIAGSAQAEFRQTDVPTPVELAMAIDAGCERIGIDETGFAAPPFDRLTADQIAESRFQGLLRATFMRQTGVDLCHLGEVQIDGGADIAPILRRTE